MAVVATLLALAAALQMAIMSGWDPPLPHPALPQHRVHSMAQSDVAIFEGRVASARQNAVQPQGKTLDEAAVLWKGIVQGSETVGPGPGPAAESVTMVDQHSRVWIADAARTPAATTTPGPGNTSGFVLRHEPLAYLGAGRVLGFKYDGDGSLVACDCVRGLLKLEGAAQAAQAQAQAGARAAGQVGKCEAGAQRGSHPASQQQPRTRLVVLANCVSPSSPLDPRTPITYADGLDIAADGTVYFTDAQSVPTAIGRDGIYDPLRSWQVAMMGGVPSGRLLRYSPSDGSTIVLAKGLWFANGVAISADGSFVAVAETNRFRVMRYWLTGCKAGTLDTLIEGLPGFPDGVSQASNGNFWVAVPALRPVVLPLLKYRALRALLAWLPGPLHGIITPAPVGLVLKVSPDGQLLTSFKDATGCRIHTVTAAEEQGGRLWLGSLGDWGVAYLDVKH